MIDIHLLRENPEVFKTTAVNKGMDASIVDTLLKVDTELSALRLEVETERAQQNATAKKISQLEGTKRDEAIADMQTGKEAFKKQEEKLRELEAEFQHLILLMPNPTLEKVPVGKDDTENVEIRTWGELPTFDFEAKDHITLGESLDIIDIPRGVKVSGSRFYFLKNEGAMLELAILRYTLEKLVSKGFTPFVPPVLVKHEAMTGTSYFPGGEEQTYAVGVQKEKDGELEADGLYLVGTSEVPVASYHYDEMLSEEELPKLYAGISNCFRREAGTYGKDTQGLYRIHQFQKVEQVVISKNDPEESARLHDMILKNAEEVLQDLKLPYRVVDVCTGDIGQGQVYKNDIETWMPSRDSYGETHSCSTFYEFQSRRLKLRYKDAEGKKKFCHTLNNTCIASPRILIPLLEIYQQADGSVVIPEVLRPYMMGKEVITTKK
ncbi:MAG: serine--tRNA ligase [Candidatus Gracilibacteria bacterium]|nr:serine--tRNA ligase [Candidatus Gracilibacteria bacterium]